MVAIVESAIDRVLPKVWSEVPDDGARGKHSRGTEVVSCVSRGMQQKCHFRNIAVRRNEFIVCGPSVNAGAFPNPLFLPDGQPQPLIQYHRYRGHRVRVEKSATGCECTHTVSRPTVFLYRMSGHSTYHLWENNLGPFYATLQEFPPLVKAMNDPTQLLVVFADDKPVSGPKAPHLLDQLLRTFTDMPLINASTIEGTGTGKGTGTVCFEEAVVGTSANSFQHTPLLHQMMRNIVGYAPPPPLPPVPRCLFISRNHKSVIRGRKIANEAAVIAALNATLIEEIGAVLEYVQFETLSYRDQVALAMRTNIMFSPHGGGVANCIWMAKGSVMVEFVAPVGKTLLNMYRAMCGKSGVSHVSFLAEPDPADAAVQLDNPRLFSNMVVPPERIVENARKALKQYQAAREKRQQQR
jgi:hypothetical protein